MSARPVIDAGPALNFFSSHQERLLIAVLGPLSAPEAVQDEVLRKAAAEERFAPARSVWGRLGDKYMKVLSDDITPELANAVRLIAGVPIEERLLHSKDIGETMVVAHAVVLAETGESVTVLIDDVMGARMASKQVERFARLRRLGRTTGEIRMLNTPRILEHAIRKGVIQDKGELRLQYNKLRALDDGLVSLEQTRLLRSDLWRDQQD